MLESSSVCIGLKCVWNGRSKQEKLNSNCDKSIFEEQSILLSGPYGDDVAFIRQFNQQIIIGLSDGVSGNRHHGLDPYQFAHELINSCLEQTDIVHGSSSMRGLVHRAIRSVEKRSIFGSATLCLLSIDKCSSCLRSLNIGDSGFMLIRNKQLLLRSVPQYHRGSSPFQLSSFPRTHLFSSTNLTRLYQDKPSDGQYLEQHLQIGDLLLIASDGLFDNLYEDFIVQILNNHLDANHSIESLQNVCEFLVESACHAHIKRDDILVLLFVVVPCSRVSINEQMNVKRKTTSSSSSSDCSLNEKDEQSLDLFIFED